VTPPAGKVLATVFWNSPGVLLVDFLEYRCTVNASRYHTTLKKLSRSHHERMSPSSEKWHGPPLYFLQKLGSDTLDQPHTSCIWHPVMFNCFLPSRSTCQDIISPAVKTSNVLPAHGSHSRDTTCMHSGWTQTYHML